MGTDATSRASTKRAVGMVPLSSILHSEPSNRSQDDGTPRPKVSQDSSSKLVRAEANIATPGGAEHNRIFFDPVRGEPPGKSATSGSAMSGPRRDGQPSKKFGLRIVQQPLRARACGLGERDRRVIDPPPVLQLLLEDFDPSCEEDIKRLEAPYNLVHCTLHEASNKGNNDGPGEDVTVIRQQSQPSHHSRRLMGTLAMSPFVGLDIKALEKNPQSSMTGIYYIFHDVSCRQNGLYRLVFKLVPVDPSRLEDGARTPIAAEVYSDVFEVFSAKDFPGMLESTPLVKALKKQGANVSVKRGSDKTRKGDLQAAGVSDS